MPSPAPTAARVRSPTGRRSDGVAGLIRRLLLATALLAGTSAVQERDRPPVGFQDDLRRLRLVEYFSACECPAGTKAARFIEEADEHHLDWRLLPSLAVVETSGGKHVRRRNNWFGWNNGQARFASVDLAIHTVAERLAESDQYRGKGILAVLRLYNSKAGYPERVLSFMREIGPAQFTEKEGTSNVSERASDW